MKEVKVSVKKEKGMRAIRKGKKLCLRIGTGYISVYNHAEQNLYATGEVIK